MRVPRFLLILAIATTAARADEPQVHQLYIGFDQSFVAADTTLDSWVQDGPGKLRYDEGHDGFLVPHAFLAWSGRIAPTIQAHATLNANGDGDAALGLTEAYVELRPVPSSAWQRRWRVGAFYPHVRSRTRRRDGDLPTSRPRPRSTPGWVRS